MLDPRLAELAEKIGRGRDLRRGEALFRREDKSLGPYLASTGAFELIRSGAQGQRILLHRAEAGSSFAEAALYSPRYHCDAVALGPARALLLPKEKMLAAFAADAGLAQAFAAQLARELMRTRTRFELAQIRNARERLTAYLALDPANGRIGRGRPLKILAAELGLTHEAFYRALAALEKKGAVRRTGERIILCHPSRS